MWSIKNWRRRWILKHEQIPDDLWRGAFGRLPLLHRLALDEQSRLRELSVVFRHEKVFEGTHGLEVTDRMRLIITLQACLLILNLDLDWYSGWSSVVVYPAGFIPEHKHIDEAGVVHTTRRALNGEAWHQGPVVLSWPEVAEAGAIDGTNLVTHEFAHKLDMQNGAANGMPPLHRGMERKAWTEAFSQAFADFRDRLDRGEATTIDPYGAENPAEFFAVLSEIFFETPIVIRQTYPNVFEQLKTFYRQDPLQQ